MKKAVMLALVLASAIPLSAAELYLHVRVQEADHTGKVSINLPYSVIEKALPLMPDVDAHARIEIDGHDIDHVRLRQILAAVRNAREGQVISVQSERETVRVQRDRGFLQMTVTQDAGNTVTARIPFELAEAFAGDGERVDFRAAVRVLARRGAGELVMVNDDHSTVRVWVDASSEAAR